MAIKFHWMHRNAWDNNKHDLIKMVKFLDEAGVVSVLLPYGPEGLDYLLYVPQMLNNTDKLRVLIAIPAYAATPEYVAKTFRTMIQFNGQRLDLNLVAGNYDEERAKLILSDYPGDISHIDSHEKRVALTGPWIEKFNKIMGQGLWDVDYVSYVVGTSDATIDIANKHTDYLIINDNMLTEEKMSRLINTKPMLSIDPLIIDSPEDRVEYYEYNYQKVNHHTIRGTYPEVLSQIKEISNKFQIFDFIVHTDQKDLTKIFQLIKDLSKEE
jgi:alkanesulfonate monooxygenase SsuD/methylene tetrahydromethanopterin reductase-like flavin-dependent oxidoreductase (luciferase family)